MPFFYGIFGILSNYIFRDHDKIKFEGEYIHNVIVIVMERERERERYRDFSACDPLIWRVDQIKIILSK